MSLEGGQLKMIKCSYEKVTIFRIKRFIDIPARPVNCGFVDNTFSTMISSEIPFSSFSFSGVELVFDIWLVVLESIVSRKKDG
jgi:hypothetical protein